MKQLPFTQDLRVIPGVDWFHQFKWSSKDGSLETPIQLDGVLVTGFITQNRDSTQILDLTPHFSLREQDGIIELNVPGTITETLVPMIASYYINVKFPTEEMYRLCEGTIIIW